MISEFRGEYEFLSNFYPAPLEFCGIRFPSSEHAYQAMKTRDHAQWIKMSLVIKPGDVKKMGRKVDLDPMWERRKVSVMKEIVTAKFRQNSDLLARLLATGDEELVEGNWWRDTFWGVYQGKGQNMLGKILMSVRDELR